MEPTRKVNCVARAESSERQAVSSDARMAGYRPRRALECPRNVDLNGTCTSAIASALVTIFVLACGRIEVKDTADDGSATDVLSQVAEAAVPDSKADGGSIDALQDEASEAPDGTIDPDPDVRWVSADAMSDASVDSSRPSVDSRVEIGSDSVATGAEVDDLADGGGSDETACDTGTFCLGVCADVLTDNANCGGCKRVCAGGTVCASGTCVCAGGGTRCGSNNACTAIQSDVFNCGLCGHACAQGEVCSNGACEANCAVGDTDCGGNCVNLSSDPFNCGACYSACPVGAKCADAVCTCGAGTTLCGSECTNTTVDPRNCGACGIMCGNSHQITCLGGTCSNLCDIDAGMTVCGGVCVNLQTDSMNCGSCGTTCPETNGTGCVNGTCPCPPGYTQCPSLSGRPGFVDCVDTTTSNLDCGACGNACLPSAPYCNHGTCSAQCTAGLTYCISGGGGPFGGPGCANLETDKSNCGGCGVACTGSLICAGGQCACAEGYANCDGSCASLLSDNDNCGTCGTRCAVGTRCQGGACI